MKKTAAFRFSALAGCFLALGLGGCNQNPKSGEITETSTSGSIKITADEAFQPIVDAQLNVFHKLYTKAKITPAYKAEGPTVQDLLNDSARLIVLTRQLTDQELETLSKRANMSKSAIRATKIAYDGVALILHPDNKDTLLSLPQLKEIFTGKIKSWKQLNPKSALGDITIVFDNNNSSSARFMQDSVTNKQPFPSSAYASKSIPAVIDYVAQNKNAIGVIGNSWISDFDDSTVVGFTNRVKVAAISRQHTPANPDNYFQPYQAYLAQGTYPLRREIYIISREPRAGLGTGFVSFSAGDKGQRIVLKSGLVPARGVVRLVQVKQ